MKYLLSILGILISTQLLSQSYTELIKKAEQSRKDKNFTQSGKFYEEAFRYGIHNYQDGIGSAEVLYLANNKNKSIQFLKETINLGWRDVDYIKNDKIFDPIRNEREFITIIESVSNFNSEIIKVDSAFHKNNYLVAIDIFTEAEKFTFPKLTVKEFHKAGWAYMMRNDTLNALRYFKKFFISLQDNTIADEDLPAYNIPKIFSYFKGNYGFNLMLDSLKSQITLSGLNNYFENVRSNKIIVVANKKIFLHDYIKSDSLYYLFGFPENDTLKLFCVNCDFDFGLYEDNSITFPELSFYHCNFESPISLKINVTGSDYLFSFCRFYSWIELNYNSVDTDDISKNLSISDCNFEKYQFNPSIFYTQSDRKFSRRYKIGIIGNQINTFNFINNQADGWDLMLYSNLKELYLNNNKIHDIIFYKSDVERKLEILNCNINNLGFEASTLPQSPTVNVYWNSLLRKHKLGLYNYTVDSIFTAESDTVIGDDNLYTELNAIYSIFQNQYRSRNDLESYNASYIELKDIETKRLKYLYIKEGGFENFFRWKLSNLLKFYAQYGTNPARAVVVSVWVLLGFAVFYFFFPSEWDVTSKSKLLSDFKDFIHKNDKGYVKPFLAMTGGFATSLLNAITLSLNSFVTLGFGNIPTKGAARYVCILQGFIGWFLLSIFTVALINQVLF